LERSDNPGYTKNGAQTLKGFGDWRTLSGSRLFDVLIPGLSLRSNPGLKLANAFGVISNTFEIDTTKELDHEKTIVPARHYFLCAIPAFAQREQEIKKYEDALAVSLARLEIARARLQR